VAPAATNSGTDSMLRAMSGRPSSPRAMRSGACTWSSAGSRPASFHAARTCSAPAAMPSTVSPMIGIQASPKRTSRSRLRLFNVPAIHNGTPPACTGCGAQ
jgi:hypothetical protein